MFVGWWCDACNLPLTEHAWKHWARLAALHQHACARPMELDLDVQHTRTEPAARSAHTKPVYFSNGGGDRRFYSASTLDGYITVEQLAAVLGVNAQTARDIASGRNNGRQLGEKVGGTWFVEHSDVLALLSRRWSC